MFFKDDESFFDYLMLGNVYLNKLNSADIVSKLQLLRSNLSISFIGRVSTGKSKFINQLLQFDLLPSSSGQTTLYSIFIKFTDTDKYNVVLEYNISSEESSLMSLDNLDELKEYLCKEKDNINIKRMQIELPKINYPDLLHKCVLIDHPAIGYSKELDKYVLQQCYQSHVFVLFVDAKKIIGENEYVFLDMLYKTRIIAEIKFVITFMDCSTNKPGIQRHYKTRINEIIEKSKIILITDQIFISNLDNTIFHDETMETNNQGTYWCEYIKFICQSPTFENVEKALKNFDKIKKNKEYEIEKCFDEFLMKYFLSNHFAPFGDMNKNVAIILSWFFVSSNENINMDKDKQQYGNCKHFIKLIKINLIKMNAIDYEDLVEPLEKLYFKLLEELYEKKEIVLKYGISLLQWNIRFILFFTEICLVISERNFPTINSMINNSMNENNFFNEINVNKKSGEINANHGNKQYVKNKNDINEMENNKNNANNKNNLSYENNTNIKSNTNNENKGKITNSINNKNNFNIDNIMKNMIIEIENDMENLKDNCCVKNWFIVDVYKYLRFIYNIDKIDVIIEKKLKAEELFIIIECLSNRYCEDSFTNNLQHFSNSILMLYIYKLGTN